MKRIIIPTDFSEESNSLVHYGIHAANALNSEIILINVIDSAQISSEIEPDIVQSVPDVQQAKILAEKIKVLYEKFMDQIREEYKTLPSIHFEIKVGKYATALRNEGNKEKNSVLLLSTEDEKGIFGTSLESKEEFILDQTKCPIWFIPPAYEYKPIDRIVYATDMNEADMEALKEVSTFAEPYSANIYSVHITEDEKFAEQIKEMGFVDSIRNKIGYQKINLFTVYNDHTTDAINEFADGVNADLTAILKKNRSFLQSIFSKSHTKSLIIESPIPVMVFHES